MSNKKKIERIIDLLDEKGIVYRMNHHSSVCGLNIDIYVPKYRIAVFDGHSQEIYEKVKHTYAPLFIRDEETEDFILEKVRNLFVQREEKLRWLSAQREIKEKNRMYAVLCEARHREKMAIRAAERAERKRIKEEKAAAKKKAERPRRKRIVRYEKV